MKLRLNIFIFLFLYSTVTFACLNTYQFKIFPIGINGGKIISIDAQIYRTEHLKKDGESEYAFPRAMWIVKTYVSIYTENQELISSSLIETKEILQDKYLILLQSGYNKGLNLIKEKYKDIEYLKPTYLSFCDFQKKCEVMEVKHDTLSNIVYIVYQNKKNTIEVINNSEFYGFNKSFYFTNNLFAYRISSTRIYKTKSFELVIGHFETGHEISMGWISDEPAKTPKDEYDVVILSKEHTPKIDFTKLETAVYEEPLLHHGYGFDIFIVNKQVEN